MEFDEFEGIIKKMLSNTEFQNDGKKWVSDNFKLIVEINGHIITFRKLDQNSSNRYFLYFNNNILTYNYSDERTLCNPSEEDVLDYFELIILDTLQNIQRYR